MSGQEKAFFLKIINIKKAWLDHFDCIFKVKNGKIPSRSLDPRLFYFPKCFRKVCPNSAICDGTFPAATQPGHFLPK